MLARTTRRDRVQPPQDDGKLYVSEDVPPVYRRLLRNATCATPNDFEASLLTGVPIDSLPSLLRCLSSFHDTFGLPHVIISSATVRSSEARAAVLDDSDWPPENSSGEILVCAGSSKLKGEETPTQWVIPFPKLAEHYEGVGDLFSALVLARFPSPSSPSPLDAPTPLAATAQLAIASLQGVLSVTRSRALSLLQSTGQTAASLVPRPDESSEAKIARLRAIELRLADPASRDALERPTVRWRARRLRW